MFHVLVNILQSSLADPELSNEDSMSTDAFSESPLHNASMLVYCSQKVADIRILKNITFTKRMS